MWFDVEKFTKVWPSAIVGVFVGMLGGWDTMAMVMLAFIGIDYITGLLIGWLGLSPKTSTGHLSSEICWLGLAKKFGELVAVVVGVLLDKLFMDSIGYNAPIFRSAFMLLIISAEGISILENLGILHVPLPSFVLKALEQLQKQSDAGKIEPEKIMQNMAENAEKDKPVDPGH